MEITVRIKRILEDKRFNPAQFADELNINRSRLSHILTGRNNPSLEIIQAILKTFPEISPDWLLMGKGEIYIEHKQDSKDQKTEPDAVDLFSYPISNKTTVTKESSEEYPQYEATQNRISVDENEKKRNIETSVNLKNDVTSRSAQAKIKFIAVFYSNGEYEILNPQK